LRSHTDSALVGIDIHGRQGFRDALRDGLATGFGRLLGAAAPELVDLIGASARRVGCAASPDASATYAEPQNRAGPWSAMRATSRIRSVRTA
jgi:hypothetical protein